MRAEGDTRKHSHAIVFFRCGYDAIPLTYQEHAQALFLKEEKMADVTIEVRKNGPYRIHGEVTLVDHEGNPIPIPEGKRKVTPEGKSWISLCRCGGSVMKPFCDGTHSRIGFIGAEEAVEKTDAIHPLP
jgi:3-phenylpropionate/trans-cinnamate dioxygenase ferredoxin subunit